MALGSKEQASNIVPNLDGTGNDVFLKQLPEYVEEEKFTGIKFRFVDEIESEYTHNHFDPFGADTEKRKDAGLARTLHLYGALMTKENYALLQEYDESNDSTVENIATYANSLIDENIFEIPLRILVAYSKKGYVTMPAYGDVISSKFKPKKLQHTPASKTTLKPVERVMDDEVSGGSSQNDM